MDYIKERKNRVYILSGNANIENEEKNGTNMTFYVSDVEQNTEIELPYIYYLGYSAELINENGEITKLDTFESDNGFVAINLSEGMEGKIEINYTGTTLMKISYFISIGTAIILVIGVLCFNKRILQKYYDKITKKWHLCKNIEKINRLV